MLQLPRGMFHLLRPVPIVPKKHTMSRWQRFQYWVLVTLFIFCALFLWMWWLQPQHWGHPVLYWMMTVSMFYQMTVLPWFYVFFLGQMRTPCYLPPEQGLKVAMVTLTVPGSESIQIVRQQLEAMTRVTYPHACWILVDKIHSPEIRQLAESLGVRYFSRHDVQTWGFEQIDRWNQPDPPYKAKTKAGNVNAWLQALTMLGEEYGYFTQLDIDHRPNPDYLDRVLGYFRHQQVAWVQAPSVYGNLEVWTARGSAEQEFVLQGPLQRGFFGFSDTPFIIGSHSTYRMGPIREIGGFQPTRAEDHLDTVLLASRGYRGVFVPEVIAVGDGPENFETYLGQQFAWAYSMIQVLFQYTPTLLWNYTLRQAGQFLFAQTWYALWSTTTAILFFLPCVALLTNQPISHTEYFDFLLHSLPQATVAFATWWWSRKWFEPKGVCLSWRGIVLHMARWPVVLSALIQVILRVQKPYMITRKGVDRGEEVPFSLASHVPYFMLVLIPLGVCWIYLMFTNRGHTQGYLLFALQGALGVFLVYMTALGCDIRELHKEEVRVARIFRLRMRPLSVALSLLVVFTTTGAGSGSRIAEAIGLVASSSTQTMIVMSADETVIAETEESSLVLPSVTQMLARGPAPVPMVRAAAELPSDRMFLGVYDVWTKGFERRRMDVEINFFDWTKSNEIAKFLRDTRSKGRLPVVTIEPFTTDSGDAAATLMSDTVSGANDRFIRANARAVKGDQLVLMRFSHEMELIGNYPWSTPDREAFISSYRRYVDIFREEGVTNVRWIWSPAGNPEALGYYPGNDVVDYIGLTVLGFEAWDLRWGDHVQSFDEIFGAKYERFKHFGKPVIIPELGVSGDYNHKKAWLAQAFSSLANYDLLVGVIYFNAFNAENAWMGDRPDWRIDPDLLPRPENMPRR